MNSTPQLPNELFKPVTLYTLGGSAGAVWLICLVLGSFDPDHDLFTPLVFRIIAILFSMLLSVLIFYHKKSDKITLENYLLIFLNGLLIFSNASGLNAISSGIPFENSDNFTQEATMINIPIISLFHNQVYWWEDEDLFIAYREMRKQNQGLKTSLQKCEQLKTAINNSNKTIDSLKALNKKLTGSYRACQRQLKIHENLETSPTFKGITGIYERTLRRPVTSVNASYIWVQMKAEKAFFFNTVKYIIINDRKLSIQEIRIPNPKTGEVCFQVKVPNNTLKLGTNNVTVKADQELKSSFKLTPFVD